MTLKSIPLLIISAVVLTAITGCNDSAVSRQPSVADIEEANQTRTEYIDSLNIPDDQKQAMKDRLGKPKTENPGRGK